MPLVCTYGTLGFSFRASPQDSLQGEGDVDLHNSTVGVLIRT